MFKTAEGLLDFVQHTEGTRAANVKLTFVTEDTPISEWKQWLEGGIALSENSRDWNTNIREYNV